jgi:beta-1,4-mannosyl-glycoprotein beta-1,4-N-acetylglucosaminyltransferase
VIFSVELDLLEIRFKELWPFVDLFIVLEADKTFTGKPKRLLLKENLKNFLWAKEKFWYELYNGLEKLSSGESPFKNENKMREQMKKIIERYAKNGDIIICSDVDEIPSSHTIELLKECEGYPDIMHLQLKTYFYSFEYFYSLDDSWRANVNIYNKSVFSYDHVKKSNHMLADSGIKISFNAFSNFIFDLILYQKIQI